MSYHDMKAPSDATLAERKNVGWGFPIAIVAAIAIISLFYFNSNPATTTASVDAPASRPVTPDTSAPAAPTTSSIN